MLTDGKSRKERVSATEAGKDSGGERKRKTDRNIHKIIQIQINRNRKIDRQTDKKNKQIDRHRHTDRERNTLKSGKKTDKNNKSDRQKDS